MSATVGTLGYVAVAVNMAAAFIYAWGAGVAGWTPGAAGALFLVVVHVLASIITLRDARSLSSRLA